MGMTRKGSQVQVLHGPLKSLVKNTISDQVPWKPATCDSCQQRRRQRVRLSVTVVSNAVSDASA